MNNIPNDLKTYDLAEVCEILGVTRRTVYNYIRDGKLDAKKLGNKWRVTHHTLKKFLGINGD